MSTRTALIAYHNFSSDLYTLSVYLHSEQAKIDMNINISHVNTASLPQTFSILKNRLPGVLKSQCFNNNKIPFYNEVKHTEVGHLFEHILLEYLCLERIAQGAKNATYSGFTDWNWKEETHGTFHITIDAGNPDRDIFKKALSKTIELTNYILTSSTHKEEFIVN